MNNINKLYLFSIIAILVTGTVSPAFAVHEHNSPTNDSADLTLSTTTSGDIVLIPVDSLFLNATGSIYINSTSGVIVIGSPVSANDPADNIHLDGILITNSTTIHDATPGLTFIDTADRATTDASLTVTATALTLKVQDDTTSNTVTDTILTVGVGSTTHAITLGGSTSNLITLEATNIELDGALATNSTTIHSATPGLTFIDTADRATTDASLTVTATALTLKVQDDTTSNTVTDTILTVGVGSTTHAITLGGSTSNLITLEATNIELDGALATNSTTIHSATPGLTFIDTADRATTDASLTVTATALTLKVQDDTTSNTVTDTILTVGVGSTTHAITLGGSTSNLITLEATNIELEGALATNSTTIHDASPGFTFIDTGDRTTTDASLTVTATALTLKVQDDTTSNTVTDTILTVGIGDPLHAIALGGSTSNLITLEGTNQIILEATSIELDGALATNSTTIHDASPGFTFIDTGDRTTTDASLTVTATALTLKVQDDTTSNTVTDTILTVGVGSTTHAITLGNTDDTTNLITLAGTNIELDGALATNSTTIHDASPGFTFIDTGDRTTTDASLTVTATALTLKVQDDTTSNTVTDTILTVGVGSTTHAITLGNTDDTTNLITLAGTNIELDGALATNSTTIHDASPGFTFIDTGDRTTTDASLTVTATALTLKVQDDTTSNTVTDTILTVGIGDPLHAIALGGSTSNLITLEGTNQIILEATSIELDGALATNSTTIHDASPGFTFIDTGDRTTTDGSLTVTATELTLKVQDDTTSNTVTDTILTVGIGSTTHAIALGGSTSNLITLEATNIELEGALATNSTTIHSATPGLTFIDTADRATTDASLTVTATELTLKVQDDTTSNTVTDTILTVSVGGEFHAIALGGTTSNLITLEATNIELEGALATNSTTIHSATPGLTFIDTADRSTTDGSLTVTATELTLKVQDDTTSNTVTDTILTVSVGGEFHAIALGGTTSNLITLEATNIELDGDLATNSTTIHSAAPVLTFIDTADRATTDGSLTVTATALTLKVQDDTTSNTVTDTIFSSTVGGEFHAIVLGGAETSTITLTGGVVSDTYLNATAVFSFGANSTTIEIVGGELNRAANGESFISVRPQGSAADTFETINGIGAIGDLIIVKASTSIGGGGVSAITIVGDGTGNIQGPNCELKSQGDSAMLVYVNNTHLNILACSNWGIPG